MVESPQSEDVQVHFESTPNPATMKFIFDRTVAQGSAQFSNASETRQSPWPQKSSVFLGWQVFLLAQVLSR